MTLKHWTRSACLSGVCLGAFALIIAGCDATSSGDPGGIGRQKLTLTGSSTVAPVANEIARRFESLHPNVRVDVQTGGSSRGVADARSGLADIGMVSRELFADESDLTAYPIAKDGICMIAHRNNPIDRLSEKQIAAIYSGRIRNWKELGGEDARITVVHKAAGRSTLELFLAHFGLSDTQVRPDVVIGDNEQGIKTVAGNPNALGYVSVGAAEYNAQAGTPIKLLAIGEVIASSANVRSGDFPLSRTLHFVTTGRPTAEARLFLDFAQSEDVFDLIEEHYFVPLER